MNTKYTLRTAEQKDAKFLFHVKSEAMNSSDDDKEFAEYLNKFEPEKIQVVQFEGKDVGRLRIVRSDDSIYVGGIQLLPEFQSKGIGIAIFNDLITESQLKKIPIKLEVHHVNKKAISFYKKLGFQQTGENEEQALLEYFSI